MIRKITSVAVDRLALSLFLVILVTSLAWRWFSPASLPIPELPGLKNPQSQNQPPPEISARHVFVWDTVSRLPLLAINADAQVYPASTTKMMTALVALSAYPLDQIMTVTRPYPDGQDIHLVAGERISVERLLYALLVQSANDAGEILAEEYPGGRDTFVAAMNARAKQLNLLHTQFQNPTGLDEEGHYSSAADLARLADEFMHKPLLARIVSAENVVLATSDVSAVHVLANTNQLLGQVEGVLGAKTGYTDLAGQALVTLVNRENHPVIISVLGSTDRFSDTKKLIDWVYSNFIWD
ncbi:hypothetical protein A3C34_02140 [Candidatus Amesbacteria bacterium RIFCSPHIGHO2_02_FULL_48_21]|uniref:Peptidase S11 D-alanyl-D-alanine carboxypeptidase A N-terminal domain-containing protein n=1 Tax=Candidatus Amesbacteria bacterium GW2011_GWA2_47_11 TaxID=1618357 RepID=A0A0G1UDV8_9BACT|nr:MAG: hypothetical protein UX78_C0015G0042 [Candidatus Amesbacteria bacterium GW2011_GWA2_47_11]OGC90354.1 MAG: hypothetical protein A2V48_00575 [Candidatus Amesbacteria bacterium RBG_19FT_COMBO_48_16]OGC96410.1 MAG: hypothetical protein A3C34_02140 [Candidatus Amesbacteria bacterium RIFCSPHIGHO2_02_FULL_48_21]